MPHTSPSLNSQKEMEFFAQQLQFWQLRTPSLQSQQLCTATKKSTGENLHIEQPLSSLLIRAKPTPTSSAGDREMSPCSTRCFPRILPLPNPTPCCASRERTGLAHFRTFCCHILHISYLLRKPSRQAELISHSCCWNYSRINRPIRESKTYALFLYFSQIFGFVFSKRDPSTLIPNNLLIDLPSSSSPAQENVT